MSGLTTPSALPVPRPAIAPPRLAFLARGAASRTSAVSRAGDTSGARVVSRAGAIFRAGAFSRAGAISRAGAVPCDGRRLVGLPGR